MFEETDPPARLRHDVDVDDGRDLPELGRLGDGYQGLAGTVAPGAAKHRSVRCVGSTAATDIIRVLLKT